MPPGWIDASGDGISIGFHTLIGIVILRAVPSAPAGAPVPLVGVRGHLVGRLLGGRGHWSSAAAVIGVGSLFALSYDALSQSALLAVMAVQFGGVFHSVTQGLLFVLGTLISDGANGWWISHLIGRTDRLAVVAALGAGRMTSSWIDGLLEGRALAIGLVVFAMIAPSCVVACRTVAPRDAAPARTGRFAPMDDQLPQDNPATDHTPERGHLMPTPRLPCRVRRRPVVAAVALACCSFAQAQQQPAPAPVAAPAAEQLDRIEIIGRHYDNAVGSSDAASQGTIRSELLKSRPALRPGEVLEFVPGVIVTQHSGDGKANQYFLRGFNLDHGTDFATSVNGLPVNMPTHGHGQGFSDLNFLIPELVDRIEYRKGPYFAKNGDFSAAGSADILYRTTLDEPFAALTLGQRNYQRLVGGGSTEVGAGLKLLGAIEVLHNDGPWVVPEHLRKANAVLTLSGGSRVDGWSTSLMAYDAKWNATDQIPQRAIDAGLDRFGSLDPTDGGNTQRSSLSGEWHRRSDTGATKVAAYAIDYRLKLFSNFTYALERPATGDQFSQQDKRTIYGFSAGHAFDHTLGSLPARSEFGVQLRHDRIRVGLFNTQARQILPVDGTTRDDKVQQTLLGVYGQTSVELTPWLRSIVGVRADQARFKVDSLSNAANSGSASDQLLSPKLSLIFGPWSKTEFFLNAGRGFHSNDARGTTATVDPKTGDPVGKVPGLVAARGLEVGARTEWIPGLQSSVALWKLDFDSELVYVGDAGVTEPNRPSTRHGIEWNNRYIPVSWLLVDADLAWTHARFSDSDPAGNRIPNAVDKVASIAVTARELGPWSATIQWRYLGSGALIEDNSVRSSPSLTTNLRASRKLTPKTELTLDVFNLFDRKVNDIEYFYESQLPGEAAPVADKHVHPAEPRTLRLTLRLGF